MLAQQFAYQVKKEQGCTRKKNKLTSAEARKSKPERAAPLSIGSKKEVRMVGMPKAASQDAARVTIRNPAWT